MSDDLNPRLSPFRSAPNALTLLRICLAPFLVATVLENRYALGFALFIVAGLTDALDDGVSAVYSFFDPDEGRRSLGTWLVVQLIERVRRLGQRYVYLGYWIAESRKMAYKTRFQPLEALGPGGWALLEPTGPDESG